MGKSLIRGAELRHVTTFGKTVNESSARRPGPYPTRSRYRETISYEQSDDEETGEADESYTTDGDYIYIVDSESEKGHESDEIYDDDNAYQAADSTNASGLQPHDHVEAGISRADSDNATNEDVWPEQFPAKMDLKASYPVSD